MIVFEENHIWDVLNSKMSDYYYYYIFYTKS